MYSRNHAPKKIKKPLKKMKKIDCKDLTREQLKDHARAYRMANNLTTQQLDLRWNRERIEAVVCTSPTSTEYLKDEDKGTPSAPPSAQQKRAEEENKEKKKIDCNHLTWEQIKDHARAYRIANNLTTQQLNLRWKRERIKAIVCNPSKAKAKEEAKASKAKEEAKAFSKAKEEAKAAEAAAGDASPSSAHQKHREERKMPDPAPEKGLHYRDAETDRLHSIPRISGPVSFTVHEGVQGRQFYVFGDKHFSKTGVCGARSMTFSRRLTAKTTCL
jgi:hypothetical protein